MNLKMFCSSLHLANLLTNPLHSFNMEWQKDVDGILTNEHDLNMVCVLPLETLKMTFSSVVFFSFLCGG